MKRLLILSLCGILLVLIVLLGTCLVTSVKAAPSYSAPWSSVGELQEWLLVPEHWTLEFGMFDDTTNIVYSLGNNAAKDGRCIIAAQSPNALLGGMMPGQPGFYSGNLAYVNGVCYFIAPIPNTATITRMR